MKNVLIVYENIPESTSTYLLKNVSGKDLEVIKDCHGRHMNLETESNSCGILNYWLSPKDAFDQEWADQLGLTKEECGKFHHCNQSAVKGGIDTTQVDLVILTGFYL